MDDQNYQLEKRGGFIREFLKDCLGQYPAIKYDIELNDTSNEDHTDFEIIIQKYTNPIIGDEPKLHVILRSLGYFGGIEILKGDDFYLTDQKERWTLVRRFPFSPGPATPCYTAQPSFFLFSPFPFWHIFITWLKSEIGSRWETTADVP